MDTLNRPVKYQICYQLNHKLWNIPNQTYRIDQCSLNTQSECDHLAKGPSIFLSIIEFSREMSVPNSIKHQHLLSNSSRRLVVPGTGLDIVSNQSMWLLTGQIKTQLPISWLNVIAPGNNSAFWKLFANLSASLFLVSISPSLRFFSIPSNQHSCGE